MKLTYDAILNDPRLLERLQQQAHRERAAAMHRLIVQPIKHFFADHASPDRSNVEAVCLK